MDRGVDQQVTIRALGAPGDLGWVVMAHGQLYAEQFGWDTTFEALVARIVADYAGGDGARARGGAAWIAEVGGRRVGCVFCVGLDAQIAQLRILLVDPGARGHGLGAALVERCVAFARDRGYARLVLWTNDPLDSARRIYLAAGFTLTGQQDHHSFGVDLTGQHYALDLTATSSG